ncbi:hypothetical protein AAE478_010278 [Parahypoxylon ruwenzoriense]
MSSVESDAAAAIEVVASQGITKLDLVVANAEIFDTYGKISDLQAHLVPNVFGLVWLYQATLPLLLKSPDPKWATMGSSAGFLEEKLNAFVVDSGFVETGIGGTAAQALRLDRAPLDVKDSCEGLVLLIDKATKDTHGGRFWTYEGHQQAW